MPTDAFNNISILLSSDCESPIPDRLVKSCSFFGSARCFQLDRVVAPVSSKVTKSESLGELWHNISPNDGEYTIELAVELPFCLPRIENNPEFSIRVQNSELYVSTRMLRCYADNDTTSTEVVDNESHLNYWLVHQFGLHSLIDQKSLRQVHPVPVGTFIAKRFTVRAASAETAIRDNFYSWAEGLADEVTELFEAIRLFAFEKCKHLPVIVQPSSFQIHYLSVTGADGLSGHDQFSTNLNQLSFKSSSGLNAVELDAVEKYLMSEGSTPVEHHAIGLAKSFLHQGHRDLALIQICIACESILSQAYRDFLQDRGVSNSSYKEGQKDVTLSQLLKLHLFTIADINKLQDHEKICGHLNWARKIRNEIVHSGKHNRDISATEAANALDAAQMLILFISTESH